MTPRLNWDGAGTREYGTGLDRGVFYAPGAAGVAWNGLTAVNEDDDSSDTSIIYIDGQQIQRQVGLGDFKATIEAYIYPDEFAPFDGYSSGALSFTAQRRIPFAFSYRTMVGDDINGLSNYRLHLVYNCFVKPTSCGFPTQNDDPDAVTFSWDLTTVPVPIPNNRATAHLYLDRRYVSASDLEAVENILYGQADNIEPRMPDITEVLAIFEANAIFIVTPHGDGTVTVSGPDDAVYPDATDPHKWTLDYVSVIKIGDHTYRASSF